jgi:hypothetical protein
MSFVRPLVRTTCAALVLAGWAQSACAEVTVHDTLDCGFADRSFVRLSRASHVSLTPLPVMHGSRVRREGQWRTEYHQARDGTRRLLGTWVQSSGDDAPAWLAQSCAYLGLKQGSVMAPWASVLADATTLNLPSGNWNGRVPDEESKRDAALRSTLADKGLAGGVLNLIFVLRLKGEELVSEQPLLERGRAGRDAPLAAVYQSRSADAGQSWSDPVVTTQALIFEIGKPWRAQCFLAVPLRLNGKPVPWAAPCAEGSAQLPAR